MKHQVASQNSENADAALYVQALKHIEVLAHEIDRTPRGGLELELLRSANETRNALHCAEHHSARHLLALFIVLAAEREDSSEYAIGVLHEELSRPFTFAEARSVASASVSTWESSANLFQSRAGQSSL